MFSCFFIGHGHTGQEVYPLLAGAVERLILDGVEEFLVGRYGQFDAMAARAVRTAKERHASVTLLLLEPYYRPEAAPPEGFDAVAGDRAEARRHRPREPRRRGRLDASPRLC